PWGGGEEGWGAPTMGDRAAPAASGSARADTGGAPPTRGGEQEDPPPPRIPRAGSAPPLGGGSSPERGPVDVLDLDGEEYPAVGDHGCSILGPVGVFTGRPAVVLDERLHDRPVRVVPRAGQCGGAFGGRP